MDDHGQLSLTDPIKAHAQARIPGSFASFAVQHSYYKNKTKFLILQVHRLPEQGNPQHGVGVTQMHENLKEQTESGQHKKTLHQDMKI